MCDGEAIPLQAATPTQLTRDLLAWISEEASYRPSKLHCVARLFGKNKLREQAGTIPTEQVQWAIDLVKTWYDDYHTGSLKSDKETSREQAYNNDFFIRILGYKQKPATPYTFEPKDTTSTGDYPDAVIRHTDVAADIDNIFAVVELKGASVNLDKPQQGKRNLSPVQQAFDYKTQYRSCPFIVVSNFYEFRLYNDTQLDREEWTLADLIDPADGYRKFKEWYVLMHADNFTASHGKSATELLLSDVRQEQEDIGKRFYADYKELRIDILRDIWKNNPDTRTHFDDVIQYAQTIIDRFVFICFSEDGGLLPDDTLARMVRYVDNSPHSGSMWEEFKRFFGSIDTGSERLGIPDGYNGGLFKDNPNLNALVISDTPLRQLAELGNYNYSEDLPVNVLGHIFEQSITDLEEIKRRIWNDDHPWEPPKQDSDPGRRRREGIFYTPDHIVRYMVYSTVGAYLRDAEHKLRDEYNLRGGLTEKTYAKREQSAYLAYQDVLQNLKVLDPACGSGAFLVAVFDYLLAENQRVDLILGGNLASLDEYVRDILSNNIFGVDVNEESVEITKLSLWLKTARKNKPLTYLDQNIRVGNSLISDPKVAGDKAFDWFAAFEHGDTFDVVLGNPPYVDSETMVLHMPAERQWIAAHYECAVGNWDLFVAFVEKALSRLKDEPTARFSFIIPNKILGADYAAALRSYIDIKYSLEEIVDVSREKVFSDADVYPIILIVRNGQQGEGEDRRVTVTRTLAPLVQERVPWMATYTANWTEYLATDRKLLAALSKFGRLGDTLDVHSAATVNEAYQVVEKLVDSPHPNSKQLKFVNTGTIDRYMTAWGKYRTLYIKKTYDAPVIAKADAPQKVWVEHPRIIIAGMATDIEAFPDPDKNYYAGKSTVVVTTDDIDELYYATALLNSAVMTIYFKEMYNSEAMAGGYINVKPGGIRDLPFVPYDPSKATHKKLVATARELTEAYAARSAFTDTSNSFLKGMYGVLPGKTGDLISIGFTKLKDKIKGLSVTAAADLHEWFTAKESDYKELTDVIEGTEQVVSDLVAGLFGVRKLLARISDQDDTSVVVL
jgi:hypothetical protein